MLKCGDVLVANAAEDAVRWLALVASREGVVSEILNGLKESRDAIWEMC